MTDGQWYLKESLAIYIIALHVTSMLVRFWTYLFDLVRVSVKDYKHIPLGFRSYDGMTWIARETLKPNTIINIYSM